MTLKVLSWNIWIDSNFEQVKNFLKSADADIIGLQEVRNDDLGRPTISFLESLGYHSVFAPAAKVWGGKTWHDGPAVFTKLPIVESKTYLLGTEDQRAAARADIQIGNKLIHVFSTHLTHTHQQESEIQTKQVEDLLKEIPQELAILIGDFNATPTSSTIKKIEEKMVTANPGGIPTWSVYPEGCTGCNPQKIDTTLDYIFTTKDINTSEFKVEDSKASDHLPISVIVNI